MHAKGLDCVDNGIGRRQVVGHAEHAVNQVEFQLLHTRQLAQFVLDKRLLGRAVHRFDAKTAHAGACRRRSAKFDDARTFCPRAATVGMGRRRVLSAVIVIVIVIVISVGFVRGVNGIAHQGASRKGACCQVKTL